MIRGHIFIDVSVGTFIVGDVFVSERKLAFFSSTEAIMVIRWNITGFAS